MAQDKLMLQSHQLQEYESKKADIFPQEGQRQRISRLYMIEPKTYESCQEE